MDYLLLPYNMSSGSDPVYPVFTERSAQKPITHHHGTWSTQNELDYLTKECGYSRDVPRMSRIRHLERYRNAMELRSDWRVLNKEVIRDHVDKLIATERDQKYITRQYHKSNTIKEKQHDRDE